MPESVQSCFELSIHFPVFFSRELCLVAVHGWFALQTNVWKVVYANDTMLGDVCLTDYFSSESIFFK